MPAIAVARCRVVGWCAGYGVGGLRHLAIPSGEGLPPDRYARLLRGNWFATLDTACHGQRRWCAILGSIQTDLLVNCGAAGEDRPLYLGTILGPHGMRVAERSARL